MFTALIPNNKLIALIQGGEFSFWCDPDFYYENLICISAIKAIAAWSKTRLDLIAWTQVEKSMFWTILVLKHRLGKTVFQTTNTNFRIEYHSKPFVWSIIHFKSISSANIGTYTCKFRHQNFSTTLKYPNGINFLTFEWKSKYLAS